MLSSSWHPTNDDSLNDARRPTSQSSSSIPNAYQLVSSPPSSPQNNNNNNDVVTQSFTVSKDMQGAVEERGYVSAQTEDDTRLLDPDDILLAEMGYKQELLRGFNGFMSFSFCMTAVAVLSSISIVYYYGLSTGGPVVMIWGFIITASFTIVIGAAMAEICSAYPSAGSVYHWAGNLAEEEWAPLASYICGWFNLLGNACGDASFAFGFAQVLSATIQAGAQAQDGIPFYVPGSNSTSGSGYSGSGSGSGPQGFSTGETVGVAIAIAFAWAILNVLRVDRLGWVNAFSSIFQMTSAVVIIIVILSSSFRNTNTWVWTQWENTSGWDNTGYVILIGLLFSTFSFSGYEAGAHMAEETRGASKSAPWGVLGTCIGTFIVGLIYLLGLLYATVDADAAASAENSAIFVYMTACNNTACGLGLSSLLVINLFFAGSSSLTVTTRIFYAMARDDAIPGSKYLRMAYVHPILKVPLVTVLGVFLFDAVICLLPLGSTAAFAAITGLTTIGYQVSYAIPLILRCTAARNTFVAADFKLGMFSIPFHAIGATWLIFTSVILFWPTNSPVVLTNMNWVVVVVGGVFAIAFVYWIVHARFHFRGPARKSSAKQLHSTSTQKS